VYGDRVLLVPLIADFLEATIGEHVAPYATVVTVEAGEDGGPGGNTPGTVVNEGVLKGGVFFCEHGAGSG